MRRPCLIAISFVLLSLAIARADNWPAWRGPTGQGVCSETGLPLKWSPAENVKWKVPLPDTGNSSPVIWGDKVFVTQATEKGTKRALLCFAKKDGTRLWEKSVAYNGEEPTHMTNPYCAASPVTDGECVVVWHGSAGVYCYDLNGRELWHRDLGPCIHIWGSGSSPVLYKDLVFLNFGPGERTFLIAMNKKTGKDVWKVDVPGGKTGKGGNAEWVGSWSTPVIADVKGQTQLIMSWAKAVKGYNPDNGELLWTCGGLEKDAGADRLTYTSPLVTPDTIVAMAGFTGPSMAFKTGGTGDVTAGNRLWRTPKNPQRIGSGVIVGNYVYAVNEPGLVCLELKTGKPVWNEPVSAGIWGSIVLSEGRLYVTARDGETWVVAAKPEYELLARNPLNKERTMASIGVSDGELFVRTYKHLWCVGKK